MNQTDLAHSEYLFKVKEWKRTRSSEQPSRSLASRLDAQSRMPRTLKSTAALIPGVGGVGVSRILTAVLSTIPSSSRYHLRYSKVEYRTAERAVQVPECVVTAERENGGLGLPSAG